MPTTLIIGIVQCRVKLVHNTIDFINTYNGKADYENYMLYCIAPRNLSNVTTRIESHVCLCSWIQEDESGLQAYFQIRDCKLLIQYYKYVSFIYSLLNLIFFF